MRLTAKLVFTWSLWFMVIYVAEETGGLSNLTLNMQCWCLEKYCFDMNFIRKSGITKYTQNSKMLFSSMTWRQFARLSLSQYHGWIGEDFPLMVPEYFLDLRILKTEMNFLVCDTFFQFGPTTLNWGLERICQGCYDIDTVVSCSSGSLHTSVSQEPNWEATERESHACLHYVIYRQGCRFCCSSFQSGPMCLLKRGSSTRWQQHLSPGCCHCTTHLYFLKASWNNWEELQDKQRTCLRNVMQSVTAFCWNCFLVWPLCNSWKQRQWLLLATLSQFSCKCASWKEKKDRGTVPYAPATSGSGTYHAGSYWQGLQQDHIIMPQPIPNLALQGFHSKIPPGCDGSGMNIFNLIN